jgi:2-keto-4-pentenoate hydratase/2-oxohepta-3-ene-1,7-dioic acid hydratase in catechol pathway
MNIFFSLSFLAGTHLRHLGNSPSRYDPMYPGEFVGSGTVGFGCGKELDRWIKPGDLVELEVEGIGTLRNREERRA